MEYPGTASSNYGAKTEQSPQSLLTDSGRIIERLSEILGRTVKIGDQLHGSVPRDTPSLNKPAAQAEPQPTVRRHIDRATDLLAIIEGELNRIETRL